MKRLNVTAGLMFNLVGGVLWGDVFASDKSNMNVLEIPEVMHDVSLPLREMALVTSNIPSVAREIPLFTAPPKLKTPYRFGEDKALQKLSGLPLETTTMLNFLGLGVGFPGFSPAFSPPDPNAAVGLTQIVEWVNVNFAVFNKQTGQLIAGPFPGNSLWQGFGGPCEADNNGDPIVVYDQIANRWVMTQFAVTAAPFMQCVAISTTSDATGTYNRYAFDFGTNFNDYGKLGIWPDAYYMSLVMFPNGAPDLVGAIPTAGGPAACALDRTNMLQGLSARPMQCFQPVPAAGNFLPSNLDGQTLPPAGSPNYFVGLNQDAQGNTFPNSIALWKFHVDWQTPANSSFNGPTALAVQPFNPIVCNDPNSDCIPQPGTNDKLEVLSDRMLYRLAYRNFGRYQSMVVNHNVQVGNQASGTRWYEIRVNNQGTPAIFQQGTYMQPSDNNISRWMGSIAMDKRGDIAMGYSISGIGMFPSIRYTGRLVTDPLNMMRVENTVVYGAGSQLIGSLERNRWGDYSSMAIDPVDDCTFWYTTQYTPVTGSQPNWSTRIVAFKFPQCR